MSSFFRHLGTVQRQRSLDRSKKNIEFTGTPDTQAETPENDFYEDPHHTHNFVATTDENNPVFSPIGHTSVNLGLDYDAEGTINATDRALNAEAPIKTTTPVADKSSKRHVFNALRAIAKSPTKQERNYSTKKEFISALRGFAVSPTKEEKVVVSQDQTVSPRNDGVPEVRAVHPFDDSVDFSDNFHNSMQTPTKKESLADETPFKTPDANNDVSTGSFSPETKEIFDLNSAMDGLRNNVLDIFKNASDDDDKSHSGAKVMNDYRVAVGDYREAIMEFESEMSQATHHSANSTTKIESIFQQIEHPLSAIKKPKETIDSYTTEQLAVAQKRLEASNVRTGTGDAPIFENEHQSVEAFNNHSDLDNTFVTAGHPLSAIKKPKETIDSYTTEHLAVTQKRSETSNVRTGIDDAPMFENEHQSVGVFDNHSDMDNTFITAGEFSLKDEGIVSDARIQSSGNGCFEVSRPSNDCPVSTELTADSLKQASCTRSLISHFEKKAAFNFPSVTKFDALPNVEDRAQTKNISNKLSIDTNVIPQVKEAPEDSPCMSTYTNTGLKAPSAAWANKQKFSFKLPDISPEKTISSASGKDTESVASSVFTDKIRNLSLNNLLDEAAKTTAVEKISTVLSRNQKETIAANNVPIHTATIVPKESVPDSPASPNLLDKAVDMLVESNVNVHKEHNVSTDCLTLVLPARDNNVLPNPVVEATDDKISKPRAFPLPQDGPDSKTLALLDKYSSPTSHNVQETQQSKGLPPRPPRRNQSGVIADLLKLNLGTSLTKEILESLNRANNAPMGVPNIGIQHIYTSHHDRDDCSEVSSLGNASTLSSAALSTLSAMARRNPLAPIENIIRDFQRVQNTQAPMSSDEVDYDSSEEPETANVNLTKDKSTQRSAFGSPFHTEDIADPPIRLNPPKVDSQKGRRDRVVHRKIVDKKEIPALAPGVLNDFEKLQEHLKITSEENKVITRLNKKVDHSRDNMQNEKLMNHFEQIEQLKMKSQTLGKDPNAKVTKLGRNFKNLSRYSRTSANLPRTRLSHNVESGTSNDWFNEAFLTRSTGEKNKNEPFSSLLKKERSTADIDQIERKKQIYEDRKEETNQGKETGDLDAIMSVSSKKKKKKHVLKKMTKMMRRKKKSKKDDEGSIGISSIGISSVASMSTVDGGKKKNRFKFLPSLRRKSKRGQDQNSSAAKCDTSRMFEEARENENGAINENFIINNMEMMEIEDLDDDILDESSASESDNRSLASGASDILPSAYVTLS